MNARLNPHILLVDDEPSVTLALKRELEDFEYEITCAESANEALKIIENTSVDLVISDMRMPEMTGAELFIIMLDKWPEIGRILLTGYSDVHAIAHAINKGKIFHYINKPWLSSQMLEVIRKYFKEPSACNLKEADNKKTKIKKIESLEENEILRDLALIDSLTGIGNRRFFDERIKKEVSSAFRANRSLSLLMADIDYFKRFTDSLGYQVGDECLRRVAKKISSSFSRGGDIPARYGGETFVIILTETWLEGAAHRAGEHLRLAIDHLVLSHPDSNVSDHITLSVGVSTLDLENDRSASDLIAKADMALYSAKDTGRNRVARLPKY